MMFAGLCFVAPNINKCDANPNKVNELLATTKKFGDRCKIILHSLNLTAWLFQKALTPTIAPRKIDIGEERQIASKCSPAFLPSQFNFYQIQRPCRLKILNFTLIENCR